MCGSSKTRSEPGSQCVYLSGLLVVMGRVERSREIARRRTRRVKLQKLRAQFAAAKSDSTKAEIMEKVRKISPLASMDG